MEDTFTNISNETTFTMFSKPIDDYVDYFDIPHIDNQSSEDNEVNVYNSIEDDDSEQMMDIENRRLQFRTKKRERNSAEKYSKGRKKAGNFLIDDLIPFHSSNRKDNKKSKIMIMFVNFAVGFLNEYIKAQRIKKKKFNPIDYLQKKNIGIEDTYKL